MNEATSISLLGRATDPADSDSWDRLAELYAPLMQRWLRQYDVQPADADDLIQEVLAVLMQELPQFDHNQQTGAFRNWLRKILVNRLRNLWRSRKYEPQARGTSSLLDQLHQLEDDKSEVSRIWNADHDQHVLSQLMEAVRSRFQDKTWEAFRRQMFDGQRADAVAAELNMPISSVYVARSRVLSTLRREAEGLVDSIG
ncbi:RNA polymerase sigma factor [Fuerstiella marisgermanici]|uniref:RNA polymerase sigma factor n=1 Tax=Fuerstiella marisgermanici TaxID=1891926 RepID=A0A1P8WH44_9PLAN|nr:sigma-70 family RNA polymerase sigma factor [Fuerstiella marisgermanici]APZ93389.1 RNA polymerase sigma factor [Fuerstiella marisgermanici]